MKKKMTVGWIGAMVLVTTVALAAGSTYLMDGQSSGFPAWSGETDWAYGFWKGECAATEQMDGVSRYTYGSAEGWAHRVHCVSNSQSHGPGGASSGSGASDTLVFPWPHGVNNCNSPCEGPADWDPGFPKASCPPGMFITGLAQSTPTYSPAEGEMSWVQCAGTPSYSLEACEILFFSNYSSCGTSCTGSNDWDYGFYKGQCSTTTVLVAVSKELDTGFIRGIRCCSMSPPRGGSSGS